MSSEANDVFRIDSMTLKNFRCFEARTIEFAPQFNVLIGENGSGKTAVLDALAPACGLVAQAFGVPQQIGFALADLNVRRLAFPGGNVESQYPASLAWTMAIAGESAEWSQRSARQDEPSTDARQAYQELKALGDRAARGEQATLPLIAYYSAERQWVHPVPDQADLLEAGPRSRGYEHCLRPTMGPEQFVLWLKTMELASFQAGSIVPGLMAVTDAVRACAPSCHHVRFDAVHGDVIITLVDGQQLPFRALSHGLRGMVATILDLAWRAFLLNPRLGAEAVRETPGVVLIDEIDLHLHPKWQRRVVDDLKRAFPKVQFIVTTHSPFIIQSLEPGELITLDDDDGIPDHEYADRSIEDVVEGVQGVDLPQMSERRRRMFEAAEEYYRLLEAADGADAEETERIKRQLDELTAPFSDNVAYHAFLNVKRIAAGLGDGDS